MNSTYKALTETIKILACCATLFFLLGFVSMWWFIAFFSFGGMAAALAIIRQAYR